MGTSTFGLFMSNVFPTSVALAEQYFNVTGTVCFRACLHGVGDPGLVGYVSFVLCPPERENKRNLPH